MNGVLKYIVFLPGYLIVMMQYFFPNEGYGKNRNVSKSSRQWKEKDKFAIGYSIVIYGILIWYWIASP